MGETPWLDMKHVVFGEVIDGMELVRKMESLGTKSGEPLARMVITDCGQIKTDSMAAKKAASIASNTGSKFGSTDYKHLKDKNDFMDESKKSNSKDIDETVRTKVDWASEEKEKPKHKVIGSLFSSKLEEDAKYEKMQKEEEAKAEIRKRKMEEINMVEEKRKRDD